MDTAVYMLTLSIIHMMQYYYRNVIRKRVKSSR